MSQYISEGDCAAMMRELMKDDKKRIAELEAALTSIAEMTDPDDPESYRADDREGCLDTVQDVANAALAGQYLARLNAT